MGWVQRTVGSGSGACPPHDAADIHPALTPIIYGREARMGLQSAGLMARHDVLVAGMWACEH